MDVNNIFSNAKKGRPSARESEKDFSLSGPDNSRKRGIYHTERAYSLPQNIM